jgi:CRP/FNR family cyclic AMP-dependent transcriptional regulator
VHLDRLHISVALGCRHVLCGFNSLAVKLAHSGLCNIAHASFKPIRNCDRLGFGFGASEYTKFHVQRRRTLVMATKQKPIFDPRAFLAKAGSGRTVSEYAKKQRVFSQGDVADAIFYIQKGKVKLTVVSTQGKEAVVAILGSGDFCGEGCLTGQTKRMATATAMTECEVMRLERAAFVRVLHKEPAFSETFVSYLLTRTIQVEADLVDQIFNSSEKRLARALLHLSNFGKEGVPQAIIAKVSQEMLAEMVGTTRPRVSFFMNKFRKLGFISYNGRMSHLEIYSSLLSVVLNERPPQIKADH